ncbi:MAG: glycyl-radical enzyme activating protein [Anaerolineaceae bacterium]
MAEPATLHETGSRPADSSVLKVLDQDDGVSRAMILNLQRLSTEDGPGLRTTVFFKGCPLNCQWCHNPESISREVQIQWLNTRCIACGACVAICLDACLDLTPQGMVIDREHCSLCLACTDACPANSLEQLGRLVTLPTLLADLLKDRSYYENSGGGVTASGGEPTLQAGFVRNLFMELKNTGIHTALDTCGLTHFTIIESLLPFTDLILYDLKDLDPNRHRQFTGSSSRLIVENLLQLIEIIRQRRLDIKIWIRTPLIPGKTAETENIRAISQFIKTELEGRVDRWELCAFNNLCRDKYTRLGLPWQFESSQLLDRVQTDELLQTARTCGLDADQVVVTGLLKS